MYLNQEKRLSGGGEKKKESASAPASDCDISSSDDTSPSKSNGHASVAADGSEHKVSNSI